MFYQCVAFFAFGCIAPVCMKIGFGGFARLGLCALNCSALAVYIMGCVWRFGEAGQFASGGDEDINMSASSELLLQESNGKFLGIYYLITWIAMGLIAVCACLGCIVGAAASQ